VERKFTDGYERVRQAAAAQRKLPSLHFVAEHRVHGLSELVGAGVLLRADAERILARAQVGEPVFGVELTLGAIGCALSHIHQWEETALSGRPRLILEDDVRLSATLGDTLDRVVKRMRADNGTVDLLYLGAPPDTFASGELNLTQGVRSLPLGAYSTFAYIISPRAARYLVSLPELWPLRFQIDELLRRQVTAGHLKAAVLDPPVVFELKTLRHSTVQRLGNITAQEPS